MLCDHLEGWDREGGRETQEGCLGSGSEGWVRGSGTHQKQQLRGKVELFRGILLRVCVRVFFLLVLFVGQEEGVDSVSDALNLSWNGQVEMAWQGAGWKSGSSCV